MTLKLENLHYKYTNNGPDVLRGINYEFQKGIMYAIMGSSGSGKTTLISIIAKLDKPTSGAIYYDGHDIAHINANKYRANNVSIIFQHYNLLANYTALDNVLLILNIINFQGDKYKRAVDLLDEMNLSHEKHNTIVRFLSGGEQQRVAIARALASDSKIILADEPTSNLDKTNAFKVMELFEIIKVKYQRCIIIATHNDTIATYADTILCIEKGLLIKKC